MAIQLENYHVSDVCLSDRTELAGRILQIRVDEIRDALMGDDKRIRAVEVEVAKPGDSLRIACVKDVIEPRTKLAGEAGEDERICVLKNVAVVTCGPIVGFQEGIIDMSGVGADYTPFSKFPLVVLRIEPIPGITPHEHEEAVRLAGLRTADLFARSVSSEVPDCVDVIDWQPVPVSNDGNGIRLPKIAYVYLVLSQGLLHDTYVCGELASHGLPRFICPETIAGNGIISGNCVSACDKNTTYHHQNNPVIRELLLGHGQRWNFVGIVLTNEPTRLSLKEESAAKAVELVKELDANAAIITKEGFGNPDADLMMLIRGLERNGVRTVAITDEYAGQEGWSQSLADTAQEADAIVSTGNANARLLLPAMDRTIGGSNQVARLAGAHADSHRPEGQMDVELQLIMGATNQLGFGELSCREF